MDPAVKDEAKLHITNGIEKASTATGVDIKVSFQVKKLAHLLRPVGAKVKPTC